MAVLQLPSLNVSELLRERCAAAALRARSSFTIEGRGRLAPRPGDFLSSPPLTRKPGDARAPGITKVNGFRLTGEQSACAPQEREKRRPE